MTSGPAAPAALNGPSSLSDPLQNSSAQHGHHLGNRQIAGIEAWRDSEGDPPCRAEKGLNINSIRLFFSPQTGTGECAHRVAGVCVCVCLPGWITMMQSAAVLPTESPVKSLPEILGVPLQRKPSLVFTFLLLSETGWCCRGSLRGEGFSYSNGGRGLCASDGHVQAGDVSYCSFFNAQKTKLFHQREENAHPDFSVDLCSLAGLVCVLR